MLNLRLIRTSDYIQRFSLTLKYIPNKTNIILDVLSRLEIMNELLINLKNLELDVLFIVTVTIIKINNKFRQKLIDKYKKRRNRLRSEKRLKRTIN